MITETTQDKNAMAALRESAETLRQLQKADAALRLSGGIAHEFNNQLQNIVASMELVRKLTAAGRAAETERFIATAMASAQNAAALNHRLQTFSARRALDPKPVNINDLITDMEGMLRGFLPRQIKLELALGADLQATHCDANHAETAILNLLLNACDAMPGGGTVTLRSSNSTTDGRDSNLPSGLVPGQYVCLAVTDTRTGMDQQKLAQAFDDVFTPVADAQVSGLAMVRQFARQNGGNAGLRSEAGHGTCVSVYLPQHRSETA